MVKVSQLALSCYDQSGAIIREMHLKNTIFFQKNFKGQAMAMAGFRQFTYSVLIYVQKYLSLGVLIKKNSLPEGSKFFLFTVTSQFSGYTFST